MNRLFLLLLMSCFTLSASAQAGKSAETLVVKTNIYCDHCLDCSDCGGKLVHDLSFEKGVKNNTVDPKAMTVSITYNPSQTNPEKLRQAISKLGYDADELKADSAAYAKFDECCK